MMSQDRRVRKTQTAIKDALISLLNKKSFGDITIQEISDMADVNRSTFYTHYLDKYDLLAVSYTHLTLPTNREV